MTLSGSCHREDHKKGGTLSFACGFTTLFGVLAAVSQPTEALVSAPRQLKASSLLPLQTSSPVVLAMSPKEPTSTSSTKGKILVLGGTGFLGQEVCKQALNEGYDVTSLSRRGLPPSNQLDQVDYRQGDARNMESLSNILNEGGYAGVVHCIGLLFDTESGLGELNKFASGSGSLLDADSTYDTITRQTAFNSIEAACDFAMDAGPSSEPLPFCFTSAAEAGWPDVALGSFIESIAPSFLKRYLAAKRAVESKLMESPKSLIRPIIVRPSLIYSMDRPASYPPVAAFFFFNFAGAPFVDRPVTVQSLATAIVRSIGSKSTSGVLRYPEIDSLGGNTL